MEKATAAGGTCITKKWKNNEGKVRKMDRSREREGKGRVGNKRWERV